MSMHTLEAVSVARDRIMAAVKTAEMSSDITVHVGNANRKTCAVNEGTSPLVTCCGHACATCGRECYAVWHIDNVYNAARRNHAENTIIRRRDPISYYDRFFASAVAEGVALVRVNETGDFETVDDVLALASVARRHPQISAIGYTRRPELISAINTLPDNCHVRYSLYRDGDATGETVRACRCALVSSTETTCPAQIRANENKRRKAAGLDPLPDWTCAQCAAHGVGCASSRAVVIFRSH